VKAANAAKLAAAKQTLSSDAPFKIGSTMPPNVQSALQALRYLLASQGAQGR
jgi:hypothetical protein